MDWNDLCLSSFIVINASALVSLGVNWTEKVATVREELRKLGADAMVITALDEIAWLLNIRGRDIPYTPYLKSYVLLSHSDIILYVDLTKLTPSVRAHFYAEVEGITQSTAR